MWHLDAARKPDDPVFVNHQGKRLTRPGVTYILNKYMAQVSWMEGKKGITPHIIRHSKAMHLLRADVDLHYIRDFLGHVQIETTELERKSAKIENAMKNAGLNVNRVGSIMTAFFTDKKVVDYDTATTADTKRYAEYYNHLLENGIYAAPSQFEAMFVSFAHTEDDIEKTCQVIESFK